MSEAALRAEIPPHISPDEPTYPVYEKLKTIHGKLEKIEREKTHTMCVSARQQPGGRLHAVSSPSTDALFLVLWVDADESTL